MYGEGKGGFRMFVGVVQCYELITIIYFIKSDILMKISFRLRELIVRLKKILSRVGCFLRQKTLLCHVPSDISIGLIISFLYFSFAFPIIILTFTLGKPFANVHEYFSFSVVLLFLIPSFYVCLSSVAQLRKIWINYPKMNAVSWAFISTILIPITFYTIYLASGPIDGCIINAQHTYDVLYFSYVSFTTVGFGDLQPIGICKGIAVVEAVTGYLLLGVLVSAIYRVLG